MSEFNFVVLFVESPQISATFYSQLLEFPILEQSPSFAMLPLREGVRLGLWSRLTAEPKVASSPGASEIAFTVKSAEAVHALCAQWTERGVTIAQPTMRLDFGTTFLALDPDGHRLRVLAPEA